MKRNFAGLCAALALACSCLPARALTVGTFDLEDFHVSGTRSPGKISHAYSPQDMRLLARAIRKSGADVLALQGVESSASMRYFAVTALQNWKYAAPKGGDAGDLFFIWKPDSAALAGSAARLDSCPAITPKPIAGRFRAASGAEYTLVCVRLNAKTAAAQLAELRAAVEPLPRPVIVLGNFGDPELDHPDFVFVRLENGFSDDNAKNSPDCAAVLGLDPARIGAAAETESSVKGRSKRRLEHPGHDIITFELRD